MATHITVGEMVADAIVKIHEHEYWVVVGRRDVGTTGRQGYAFTVYRDGVHQPEDGWLYVSIPRALGKAMDDIATSEYQDGGE